MKNWKAVAGVLLVFALGGLSGAFVASRVCHRRIERIMRGGPQARVSEVVRRLSRRLDLDQAQQGKLAAIVAEAHAGMEAIRARHEPEVKAVLDRADDKVRAILRPEQRERFERFVARRRERWKARE